MVETSPLIAATRPRAVVPTMGALHEGHRTLMRRARELVGPSGEVVVTIFVNPTQFSPGEDFDKYPRTLDADLRACEAEGVDVVYTPDVATVYGSSDPVDRVTVDPGRLGAILEGARRPGHFSGVLTVVSILLQHVGAQIALFGEKDYQQLVLIQRMCRDLGYRVQVVGVPTVRDDDGLALSSRNTYLTSEQRRLASAIPRALSAGARASTGGAAAIIAAASSSLNESEIVVDYLELRSEDLGPAPMSGRARLLIAALVGETRLIDNQRVDIGGVSDD